MNSSTLPAKSAEFYSVLGDYEDRNKPHIEAVKPIPPVELVSRSGGGKTIKSLRAFAEAQNIKLPDNFGQHISKLVASGSLIAKGEGQRMNIYFTPWQWERYQENPESFQDQVDSTPIDRFRLAVEEMKRTQKVLSVRVIERKYKLYQNFILRDPEAIKTMKQLREQFGCASKEQTRQKNKTRIRAMQALDQLEQEQRSLPQRKFCKEFEFSIHLFKNYPDVRERLAALTEKFGLPKTPKTPRPSKPSPSAQPVKKPSEKPVPVVQTVSAKVTSVEVFEQRALKNREKLTKDEKLKEPQALILRAFRYQPTRTALQLRDVMGKIDRRVVDAALQELVSSGTLKIVSRTPYTYQLVDRSTLKAVC